ncbi:hypothetical protein L3Y34_001775 [Caenorhabditis briggsae]|nr:hypothetical protein L3Y34_001775 [Caenorhabditis briggsae]
MVLLISLTVDVYALATTNPDCPDLFSQLTGLHPLANITMVMLLHLICLFSGLSRTVPGCRLAASIAWFFFMVSLVLMMLVPAFIGSYMASGLAPEMRWEKFEANNNITFVSELTAAQFRFQTAFYMAVEGQLFVFILFISSLCLLGLCAQLLAEANTIRYKMEIAKEQEKMVNSLA